MFNVCGIGGVLVDRARTKCMNCLKKLCLKFRKNVGKGLHFVRDNKVCLYGPGNGRLGSNPVKGHAGLSV